MEKWPFVTATKNWLVSKGYDCQDRVSAAGHCDQSEIPLEQHLTKPKKEIKVKEKNQVLKLL